MGGERPDKTVGKKNTPACHEQSECWGGHGMPGSVSMLAPPRGEQSEATRREQFT